MYHHIQKSLIAVSLLDTYSIVLQVYFRSYDVHTSVLDLLGVVTNNTQ